MVSKNLVIAIVGPTASGKSDLAMQLALKINGEIICADSRTIYKYMNIGTAKPTAGDQKKVVHHCLDLVEPNVIFSVAEFQNRANKAIKSVISSGKTPIIVGGSGLYVNSVLYNYNFDLNGADKVVLKNKSLQELQDIARTKNIFVSNDTWMNQRHLSSHIARGSGATEKLKLKIGFKLFGIMVDENELHSRVENRVRQMFKDGLVDETKSLLSKYDKKSPGLKTLGYPEVISLIEGNISEEQALNKIILSHNKLIKKQKTWFKRNPDIKWVSNLSDIEQILN